MQNAMAREYIGDPCPRRYHKELSHLQSYDQNKK